ncbi:haloacid dehalogenase type II [Legionella quateirensis]|uniref:(S)-2-haloacid dehalogenase n=1 Tax=Legionella quateirensis TaxID=45072 RepID=A0A378KX53_9GAMM|nr:haloacid dehalogenase type II [Legionella quateirensis]KTD46265.1 haloacid dehalogenase [Legionella quateirensis]STY18966.1 haloacid dehalogenase [Legionella quateirensis]
MKDVGFEKNLSNRDIISSVGSGGFAKREGFFSGLRNKSDHYSLASQDGCIKFILFDVFGTVVDWRGTMVREFVVLFEEKEIRHVRCEEFIDRWVNEYSENMTKISEGSHPFSTVDELNNTALNKTLEHYQILNKFTESEREQMWMVWHRLEPWPDVLAGINEMKKQCSIGILSNGNIHLLEDLSKNASLEWDIILSGELFQSYKPNPLVYQSATRELKLKASEILLVASHKYDLEAAQQCGYKTAYIFRPLEFGTVREGQIPCDDGFDFVTTGIDDLAKQLISQSRNVLSFKSV